MRNSKAVTSVADTDPDPTFQFVLDPCGSGTLHLTILGIDTKILIT